MFDHNSKRLNPCGHRFHHHCINVRVCKYKEILVDVRDETNIDIPNMMIDAPFQEWMHTHGGAGNTCPMCRVYITRVGNLDLCGSCQ